MIGQIFGRLTVKNFGGFRNGKPYYICSCQCGNITSVRKYDLLSGRTQSCGCYRVDQVKKATFNDLSGKRFGNLVAQNISFKNSRNQLCWYCECDCGNTVNVMGYSLVRGDTTTCGCHPYGVYAKVFKRDNHRCQYPKCEVKERGLKFYTITGSLSFDDWNLITLCKKHEKIVRQEQERWIDYFYGIIDSRI